MGKTKTNSAYKLQTSVGFPNSVQFHVFEITRQLPRFSMYALLQNKLVTSQGSVEFKINERLQRICMWINQNFLLPDELEFEAGLELRLHLTCLRDGKDLFMVFDVSGKVVFRTDNMLLASDLVQSFSIFLNLDCLEVNKFPYFMFDGFRINTIFSLKLHFLGKKNL